uniref:F-box protein 7 n=1 Tax=Cyprinus carpio TaxID=7962 RepID=A0A8C2PV05_CYPCA
MKLRVRINKQSSRLELDGPEPTLSELRARVRDELLPRCGLRSDVDFSLSLNGKEVLLDTGQTLSSCGVVSGDMITVVLPEQVQTSQAEAGGGGGSDSSGVRDSGMEEWMEDEEGVSPPLLCCETEDGVVPHALERLLDSSSCRNPSDCLMLTVHLLLLETGFLPQGCNVNSGEMPIGWRAAGGVYRLQYAHPLLENSLVSVVAVPMGRTLVINAVLKMDKTLENPRKLVLKPDDYVTADWAGDFIYTVYITFYIYISEQFMLCCLAVCLPAGNQHRDTDWKELYKKKYKQRKENERRGRCRFFPPHVPPIFPLNPVPSSPLPFPLYPPGIIGGDYDQAPVILPRPRFDPIGPLPGHLPGLGVPIGRRSLRPGGSRPADVRRGFI